MNIEVYAGSLETGCLFSKSFRKIKTLHRKKGTAETVEKAREWKKGRAYFVEKNSHLIRRVLYISWVLDITNI